MDRRIIVVSILAIAITLLFQQISYSQFTEEWVARYGAFSNASDRANALVIDASGNVYVAGTSYSGISWDFVTIKYDSLGQQIWLARFNSPNDYNDEAKAIAIDSLGNVYVTGNSVGSYPYINYATVKYNSMGVMQWYDIYNGPNNLYDFATSIAVDTSGNVYVTGTSHVSNTQCDYATIKYNTNGVREWVSRYSSGPINTMNYARALTLDNSGNVLVTGQSAVYNNNSRGDYATVKYSESGTEQWVAIYSGLGPGLGDDNAYSVVSDDSGNVYVTGASDGPLENNWDYATVKYNSSGVEQWVARYDFSGADDGATSIAIDNSRNVYVTGASYGPLENNWDYATVKYNSSGVEQWVSRYNVGGSDFANAIAVDAAGNVYVTGRIGDSNADYGTLKYNSSGNQEWVAIYNGTGNNADVAKSIAVDASGNVFVTGHSVDVNHYEDYLTIKYSQIEPSIKIAVKAIFEGMYYPLFNLMSRRDTVKAYLANSQPPFNLIDSSTSVIDSLSFSGVFTFPNAPTGVYYLVLRHFNSIETWSKVGGSMFTRDMTDDSYNFTTAISQAYGNNLKVKGGKYCIISGDVIQDGYIDGSDMLIIDNDAYTFASGRFLPSDLNGDGFTDAADMQIADNNNGREVIRP